MEKHTRKSGGFPLALSQHATQTISAGCHPPTFVQQVRKALMYVQGTSIHIANNFLRFWFNQQKIHITLVHTHTHTHVDTIYHTGASLNGGTSTPKNTPKWSFLVGKPMVVGYHHFRNPLYIIYHFMSWKFAACFSKPSSPSESRVTRLHVTELGLWGENGRNGIFTVHEHHKNQPSMWVPPRELTYPTLGRALSGGYVNSLEGKYIIHGWYGYCNLNIAPPGK